MIRFGLAPAANLSVILAVYARHSELLSSNPYSRWDWLVGFV